MSESTFTTLDIADAKEVRAPDGSLVRILPALSGGSMAHFSLAPGQVSSPVVHRRVEEIWYVLAGSGQMWRSRDGREATIDLRPGLALTIPAGTAFQFRADGGENLQAVAITMPPWPGPEEAIPASGPWRARP